MTALLNIETSRCLLRPLKLSDTMTLASLQADEDIMRYVGPTKSLSETQSQLEYMIEFHQQHRFGIMAVVDKATNSFIGRAGYWQQPIDGRVEVDIGFLLAKPFWGKGLATEISVELLAFGFKHYRFKRMILIADERNKASQHIAEKLSMAYERNTIFQEKDVRIYAITKKQYKKL